MSAVLPFDEDFQNTLVAYLWRDEAAMAKHFAHLESGWFESALNSSLVSVLKDYYTEFAKPPARPVVQEEIRRMFPSDKEDDSRKRTAMSERLDRLEKLSITDIEYFDKRVREFVRWCAMRTAIGDTLDEFTRNEYNPEMPQRFQQALLAGQEEFDEGTDWGRTYEHRLFELEHMTERPRVPTGLQHLDPLIGGGLGAGELGILMAVPKGFKCHAPDTLVMMHDGSVRKIKDLRYGDLLMGDDSTPRKVLQLGWGRGQMYRVTQANGDSYVVTADHVLCVQQLAHKVPKQSRYYCEQIREVTAEDYSKETAGFHRKWKGYKVGVEFSPREVPLDPYFVGLWLGDGAVRSPTITVADADIETIGYLECFAEDNQMRLRKEEKKGARCSNYCLTRGMGQQNPILTALRSVGLSSPAKKHLPEIYKRNSRAVRLGVLAGLLDSDGHLSKKKGFVFSNSVLTLCKDVCWLARSLGFKAYVMKFKYTCNGKKGVAYRTYIQGKISEIPTKLPRKQANDSPKASLRTTIKVEPIGEGEWFGVSLDGNQRYLLADFTVTHNSGTMLNFGFNALFMASSPKNVLYVTLELSEPLVGLRFDIRCSGLPKYMLYENMELFRTTVERRKRCRMAQKDLYIKYFAPRACNCNTVRDYMKQMWERKGIKFDLLVVDYLDLMKPEKSRQQDYLEAVDTCEALRGLGDEHAIPVWTAVRATRDAVNKRTLNMAHMSKAFERIGVADLVMAICQTPEERTAHRLRLAFVASRNDGGSQQVECAVDYERMRLTSDGVSEIDYEDDRKAQNNEYGGEGKKAFKGRKSEDQQTAEELHTRMKNYQQGNSVV